MVMMTWLLQLRKKGLYASRNSRFACGAVFYWFGVVGTKPISKFGWYDSQVDPYSSDYCGVCSAVLVGNGFATS